MTLQTAEQRDSVEALAHKVRRFGVSIEEDAGWPVEPVEGARHMDLHRVVIDMCSVEEVKGRDCVESEPVDEAVRQAEERSHSDRSSQGQEPGALEATRNLLVVWIVLYPMWQDRCP